MKTHSQRLELTVDVFDLVRQRAQVRPECAPSQLIQAILDEFHTTVEWLDSSADRYQLLRAQTLAPLDETTPLGQQLRPGDRLVLCETELPLPPDARPPSQPVYLRELHTGRTYPLHGLPTLVGRPGLDSSAHARLTVDLGDYPNGLRVSRRHVRLTEENGGYWIELLANNPVSLVRSGEPVVELALGKPHRLTHGDEFLFVRSAIQLQFIVPPVDSLEEPSGAPS